MKAQASVISYRPKLLLAAAALLVLVILALLPFYISLYQVQLLTYGLIAAIAALGFNLLLGYTGLLSFGHSAFFGIGAYSVAFLLRDAGIHSMELYILIGIPIAALTSALFGYICVRHTRIFFGILTLALSQVLWTLTYKFFWVTGGSDGLRVARPTLLAGMVSFTGRDAFQRFINGYYYYVLVVFAICVVLMWVIVHSPFGKALQAIRDNETRAAFLGLRIRRFRWMSFLISGTFTGLAGILWVPLNGLTTPEVLYWPFSGEIVFATLLGGFRNFTGPIVGGIIFTYLKTYAVASTEYWQLALGIVLVLLVLLLPTGIVGVFEEPPPWLDRGVSRLVAFVTYSLLLVPVLPLVGASISILLGPGVGLAKVFAQWLHIISWVLLIALTYHRGRAIGHSWLAVLPVLAAISVFTLEAIWIPWVPAALVIAGIICGVALKPRHVITNSTAAEGGGVPS
jgi:branched-chain amino acid transport system permease protein